jgi:hypothetical protein
MRAGNKQRRHFGAAIGHETFCESKESKRKTSKLILRLSMMLLFWLFRWEGIWRDLRSFGQLTVVAVDDAYHSIASPVGLWWE